MAISFPDEWVGLIPAAGKGLRLGLPYPKELYPVIRDNHYKPISQFVLENLLAVGIKHVIFVINETKSQLIGYFGNGSRFNCHFSYVVQEPGQIAEQSTSPGLAHALDSAFHLTQGKAVFFGMADTIMQPRDVFVQARASIGPEDDGALCLFPTQHPEKFGMVRFYNDQVIEIVDKPDRTDLTQMWGCILWGPRFTEHLHRCVNEQGITDFARVINLAIQSGLRFRAVPIPDGNYLDLGTYDEILELDRRLRD